MIYSLQDRIPQLAETSYIAPSADLIGSVQMGALSSVWFNCTLRADNDQIIIGDKSNVQDNSALHVDPGCPIVIGQEVTVGHSVMLHGCHIGDGSLIGIGSIILNNAKIGKQCLVGANSLVTEGKSFPDRSLILGSPAKAVRQLSDEDLEVLKYACEAYVKKIEMYKSLTPVQN